MRPNSTAQLGLAAALAWLALAQDDPLEAARKDLGAGFVCERVDNCAILASDAPEADRAALKTSIQKIIDAVRRAFDSAPQKPLLIACFKDEKGFKSYTKKRYGFAAEPTGLYDPFNRRLMARIDLAGLFIPQSLPVFLLNDYMGSAGAPAWMASAVAALGKSPAEAPALDIQAALLKDRIARGKLPALRGFLRMKAFPAADRFSLDPALAAKLLEYVESRVPLTKFFEEYRKAFKRERSGAAALEVALGQKFDGVEKGLVAYLKGLPWVREDRFKEDARKLFGEGALIRIDEELMAAAAGNVEGEWAAQALEAAKKARPLLVKMFEIQPSGLPITARMFKDRASFRAAVKTEAPGREWAGGFYDEAAREISIDATTGINGFVHEYCHALFGDDLGTLPPWLCEGLAELFENSRPEGDSLVGVRGATLETVGWAVEKETAPAISDLVNMDGKGFYGSEKVRLHYDTARAFLLYIQDKGKVVDLYRRVRKARSADTGGLDARGCREAVEGVLGKKLSAIDEDFRRWVCDPPAEK